MARDESVRNGRAFQGAGLDLERFLPGLTGSAAFTPHKASGARDSTPDILHPEVLLHAGAVNGPATADRPSTREMCLRMSWKFNDGPPCLTCRAWSITMLAGVSTCPGRLAAVPSSAKLELCISPHSH